VPGTQPLYDEGGELLSMNEEALFSSALKAMASSSAPPPSPGMDWPSEDPNYKLSATPNEGITSLRLEDGEQKTLDHGSLPAGSRLGGNQIATNPQTKDSCPNYVELRPEASTHEIDSPEGGFFSDSESENDEGCLPSRYTPDSAQEELRTSRDLELATSSVSKLTIARPDFRKQDFTTTPFFDSTWTANVTDHAGDRRSASNSTSTPNSTNPSVRTSLSSNPSRKRGRNSGGSFSGGDRDDDPPERSTGKLPKQNDPRSSIKLACPFRKHNPQKYNPNDHHVCALTPCPSISRVK
jgi:hypothetical protein